jgi:hypothetical protein
LDVRVLPESLEIDDLAGGWVVLPHLRDLDELVRRIAEQEGEPDEVGVRRMRSTRHPDRWIVPAGDTERVLDHLGRSFHIQVSL